MRLDTPAGLVSASYRQEGGYVEEVRITNVPPSCMRAIWR